MSGAYKNCVCFNLRKAARALSQRYDAALAPVGLKATQFSLLGAIYTCRDGADMAELAAELGMDRTTLTRNLAVLRKRGLTKTLPHADGRVRRVALTVDGKAALKTALPLWHSVQNEIREAFGDAATSQLIAELMRMAAVASQERIPHPIKDPVTNLDR